MQANGSEPIHPQEKQMLNQARQQLLDVRSEYLKQLSETQDPEALKARDILVRSFDPVIERALSHIACSDGPINEREANVLNVLLGKDSDAPYYNSFFRRPEFRTFDPADQFAIVVDAAIQLGGIEQGVAYDPHTDPIVTCFESLGRAVLAADGQVNELELQCLSRYTGIAHAKATGLEQRITSVNDGVVEEKETPDKLEEKIGGAEGSPSTSEVMLKPIAAAGPETVQQCVAELHALVGLTSVKDEVEALINLAKVFSIRKQRGLPVPDVSFHRVFAGNPGTGKTTVARIVAKVYGCLGLLTKGQLVEVDRSGLIGNFIGQTATKTKKVIDSAKGGVLFIDEAYALSRDGGAGNDYGPEAIEVILKSMEDYRDDLVIIAAGYTDRMATFLNSNPGLRSRFPKVIEFPDYSGDELEEIFRREADGNQYSIDDGAKPALRDAVADLLRRRGADFANAREVRNLFERVVTMQANRISQSARVTTKTLTTIVEADIRQEAK